MQGECGESNRKATNFDTDRYTMKGTDRLACKGLEIVEPSGLDESLLEVDFR